MSTPAAFYARVSSDRQKEQHTIGSQVAALIQYAETHGYLVPPEWQFQDDGCSGATLVRPGLEVGDAAQSGLQRTRLLRENRRASSAAHHAPAASTGWDPNAQQREPRTTA